MINVSVVQFCKYRLVNCDSATGYGMQNMIYESFGLLIGWWYWIAVTSFQLCGTGWPIWLSQGPIWLSHFGPKDRSDWVRSVLKTEVTEDRSDRGPKWTCRLVLGPKWPRTEVTKDRSGCIPFVTLLCNNYFPHEFITHKDLDSSLHSFPSCPVVVCGDLQWSVDFRPTLEKIAK